MGVIVSPLTSVWHANWSFDLLWIFNSTQDKTQKHKLPFKSPSSVMATPRDSTTIQGLKLAVCGTTLFIAGGMASTSAQYIPGLIATAQKAPMRSSASRMESGRLTPQPKSDKGLALTPGGVGSTSSSSYEGYKGAAQQFVSMSKTAFATQVPPELLSVLASGYLAYHSYTNKVALAGHKWVAVAALIASVFPLTGGFMVPLDHKIARLSGDEEKVEPFEDSPPDREAERRNTVAFLGQWNTLNRVRSVVMLAAGGIGLWGLVE